MFSTEFNNRIENILDNPKIKSAVTKATDTSLDKRSHIISQETNWEEIRNYCFNVKEKVINNLYSYLQKAENKLLNSGVKVFWANDGKEACNIALDILKENQAKKIVKAKSMVTEEIGLNHFLEKHNIEIYETDLGEYIVQIANETPSHITAPALHKTRQDIGKLFAEKHNIEYTENPEELTAFARNFLRDKFFEADAGISGCNFLVAETGTLILVENEGNIRFSTTTPDIHITIIGIEKILPDIESAGVFLRALIPSATGQKFSTYVSFLTPSELLKNENKKLYVIFLDNGRTELIKDEKFKQALYCIRCGACMNVCPVYKRISGHTYSSTYPGPIGSVISSFLFGYEKYGELAFASTLCGACSEICPVKIDLAHLIVENRNRFNKENSKIQEKSVFKLFADVSTKPSVYSLLLKSLKIFSGTEIYSKFVRGWNRSRTLPKLPDKFFRDHFE